MDSLLHAAEAAGKVVVDFNNDDLGLFADSSHMRRIRAKIEIPVRIHRRYLKHCHIIGHNIFAVIAGKLRVPDW